LAKLYVRAFDRGHVLRLVEAGVEYQLRETFESALVFGNAVLLGLGVEATEAAETMSDVRRRDAARLGMQVTGGIEAGKTLIRGNMVTPEPAPLTVPQQKGRVLNPDADALKKSAEKNSVNAR
jgi:glutathione-regulated potassium-efflux system protein KefB